MATAGSGDVLTGVIAALLSQQLDVLNAALTGAYLHGLAGDLAVRDTGQISLIATDLIEYLPAAFQQTQAGK
jgi:NAD(P)H-hydrate epimerase